VFYNFPKYFITQTNWANFWLAANGQNHRIISIEIEASLEPVIIYEYPWELGQKFWYLPRLFLPQNLDQNQVTIYLKKLIEKINIESLNRNPVFIKIEFDDQLSKTLGLENNSDFSEFISQKLKLKNTKKNTKTIQYLQTITLDLRPILDLKTDQKSDDFSIKTLTNFYHNSQSFWKNTNENIRRYTKKSLTQNWRIETAKTEQNFLVFYKIYNQTKDRQNFAIQTETYLKTLFNQEFSRIIILYDEFNQPQSVWFGITSDQTLTYLYGGNTAVSFDKKGQYLLHLVAVKMAVDLGLNWYDLGGYNSKLGFGKFKENYRGIVREFFGPLDIIYKPLKYNFINFLISFSKLILGRK